MRAKGSLVLISVLLILAVPKLAMSVELHSFDCNDCHKPEYTVNELGGFNVCLQCHGDPSVTDAGFAVGDASNHYGNGIAGGEEHSHNWFASSTNPAAGAAEPITSMYPGFITRQGTTSGKVACSRCHNPHGQAGINPKLLLPVNPRSATPMAVNDMCLACHKTFADAMQGNHGLLSHPMVADYASFQGGNSNYKAVTADSSTAPDSYSNGVQLVNGAVSCLSCHNVHFTDSDTSTTNGPLGDPGSNGPGDGLLLRGDGTQFYNSAALNSGGVPKATSFCTECHNMDPSNTIHGSGGPSDIGCMGCHGGHNYNDNNPSYYMLNSNYTELPSEVEVGNPKNRAQIWGGVVSNDNDGFCESCHGSIGDNFPDLGTPAYTHTEGMADCVGCHQTHAEGSFSNPVGCNDCHGSPPTNPNPGNINDPSGNYQINGYAWAPKAGDTPPDAIAEAGQPGPYSYQYADGSSVVQTFYKNESTTPHTTHADPVTSRYIYNCTVCHNTHINNFNRDHNKGNGSFQDVLEPTDPFNSKTSGNGALNPSYADLAGSCSSVYCHSNGGVNDGSGVRAGYNPTTPGWDGTKNSIYNSGSGTTDCAACHGNDATTMASRGNSSAHTKHLNSGFSCETCHANTASDADNLLAAAMGTGGSHINVAVDVAFSGLGTGGTLETDTANADYLKCDSVYCHSNGNLYNAGTSGTVYRKIKWTDTIPDAAGRCTACHNIPDVATDKQTAAHVAHVNGGTNSTNVDRDLDCNICHADTMDAGSYAANTLGAGGDAFHVNGTVDVEMDAAIKAGGGNCSNITCHSDGNYGGTQTFNNPPWTLADTTPGTLSDCIDCHGNGVDESFPGYASAAAGSEDANSHVKHASPAESNIKCEECHVDTSVDGTSIIAGNAKHVNQTIDVAMKQGGTFNSAAGSPGDGSKTCSTTYCHASGTPQWGGTVNCGDCHAASNNPANDLADSHGAHYSVTTVGTFDETNTSTAANYQINCGICHSLTQGTSHAGGKANVNYAAEVNFDGTIANGSYTAGGTFVNDPNGFAFSNATCNNLYCHGNFGGNGNNATPTWNNPASGACGTCHDVDTTVPALTGGSHDRHVKASGISCDFCHGATAVNEAGGIANRALHVNQFLNWELDATKNQLTASSTYDGANDGTRAAADVGVPANYASCAAVYCHSNVQTVPPGSPLTYSTPTWGTAADGQCGTCHKGDGVSGDTSLQDTASHTKHVSTYGKSCATCHESAGSGTTKHADYAVDMAFDATWGGSYDGTAAPGDAYGDCSASYCHSPGNKGASYDAPNTVPTWNAGALSCGDCHGSVLTITSNAHNEHVQVGNQNKTGKVINCDTCHSATASGSAVITSTTNHVNKLTNVKFDNSTNKDSDAPEYNGQLTSVPAAGVTKAAGTPVASCDNLYCHSVGNLDSSADVVAVGSPAVDFKTVAWNATPLDCADCHGDGTKANPVYTSGAVASDTANSHEKHVNDGTLCSTCHNTTTTSATNDPALMTLVLPGSGGKHLDREETVAFNTTVTGGSPSYAPLTKTCSAVSCHGTGAPQWGGTVSCEDCHIHADTDTDDFEYGNGTLAAVALDEWQFSGHGLDAASTYPVTGRAGADFDGSTGGGSGCFYCHDGGVSHDDTNYFRLNLHSADYASATDPNQTCLVCHDTNGPDGFDPDGAGTEFDLVSTDEVPKIDKYHGGAKHGDPRDAGRFCWDCHDPHGDTAQDDVTAVTYQIQMVQRQPHKNPDANGVPTDNADALYNNVVFYDNTIGAGVGGFARDSGTYTEGICNVCHTMTNQYTQSSGKGTHPSNTCTDCHKHSEDTTYDGLAFAGSGCNGCHGGGYDSANDTLDGTNYWPDNVNGNPENVDAGRHQKHMSELAATVYSETLDELLDPVNGDPSAKQIELCSYCHDTPGGANHLSGLPADVNSMYTIWDKTADNGTYSNPADTCSSVACHNNQTTPSATYGWYGGAVSTKQYCLNCHTEGGADDLANNNINPNSGLHVTTGTNPVFAHNTTNLFDDCITCHETNKPSTHIDGTAVVDGPSNTDRFLLAGLSVTDATPPTCGGSGQTLLTGCHSDKGNWERQWSKDADSSDQLIGSARCNVCHGQPADATVGAGQGDGWRTGLTVYHDVTSINDTGKHGVCETCHVAPNAPYVFGTHHAGSGLFNGNGTVEYNNNVGYVDTTATCTNVCHASGKTITGDGIGSTIFGAAGLGGNSVSCNSCHFDVGGANASTVSGYTFVGGGVHTSHVFSAATDYTTASANNTTDANGYDFTCASCHGNTSTNHINATLDVNVSNWDGAADTCGQNSCHQNGAGAAPAQTVDWYTGYAGDDKCAICHYNTPTTNAHSEHEVSIHNADIYTGTTGLAQDSDANASAHGDPTNSTTVSCYTCHNATVTDNFNDQSTSCSSCHDGSANNAGLQGDLTIAFKSKHVDGTVDVQFTDMTAFDSKAQLRDDIATINVGTDAWTRSAGGYKVDATSFDTGKAIPVFNAGKTCSTTACHNGIETPAWDSGSSGNCMACHTELPQ